ncbi:MAG: DUF72 domain-containing protein [Methanomicrobiales archaeon]|nr:DUF72 domain-containing protein [Methanomicrobiales archaeon]
MDSFVGTSGWSYDWNRGGDLQWYVAQSGLNAVELNASFYRFPFENYVKNWRSRGEDLRWSVKVHRSITHNHKFDEHAADIWKRFQERFSPLDDLIDFYLFQTHPQFQDVGRIERFLRSIHLDDRSALEVRDPSMLADDELCARLQQSAVLVSVDSPDFQNRIFPGDIIYLRMHGREDWYFHDYTKKELEETVAHIRKGNPEKVFVFFNNNHHMVDNARVMRTLLNRR